jgi:hypothetical protein
MFISLDTVFLSHRAPIISTLNPIGRVFARIGQDTGIHPRPED